MLLFFFIIIISVPAASSQKPEEVIQRYMEVVAAPLDEVNICLTRPPASKRFLSAPLLKSLLHGPPPPPGLHHLHGPAVQSVGLRGGVHGGRGPGRRARRRGQIHQVRTHTAHALHAGDVQQRHKGRQPAAAAPHQRATADSQHHRKHHFPVKKLNTRKSQLA